MGNNFKPLQLSLAAILSLQSCHGADTNHGLKWGKYGDQWLSNSSTHQNHWESMSNMPRVSDSVGLVKGLWVCISNKCPGYVDGYWSRDHTLRTTGIDFETGCSLQSSGPLCLLQYIPICKPLCLKESSMVLIKTQIPGPQLQDFDLVHRGRAKNLSF